MAIRRAGQDDGAAVTCLLGRVFRDGAVSGRVFPDPAARREKHGVLMGAFPDPALIDGYVDLAVDGSAAALWFSVPVGGPEADEKGPAELRRTVVPDNERTEAVSRILDAAHPRTGRTST